MSRQVNLPPEVLRELQRLDKRAHKAHTEGDIATEATCRQRWVELYRAAGGPLSPAPEVVLTERQAERHRTVEHVPLWRLRQRLSPLVAILRVEEVRVVNERGYADNYWIEHLSCGHTHYYFETTDYPARTKRRRCKECGDLALIASGHAGEIRPDEDRETRNNTASLGLPLSQVSDSTISFTLPSEKTPPPNPRVIEMPKPVARGKDATSSATGTLKASVERTNNG